MCNAVCGVLVPEFHVSWPRCTTTALKRTIDHHQEIRSWNMALHSPQICAGAAAVIPSYRRRGCAELSGLWGRREQLTSGGRHVAAWAGRPASARPEPAGGPGGQVPMLSLLHRSRYLKG